jgi:prepilin-type N-terminal cleavage/methylation domain-containing protein
MMGKKGFTLVEIVVSMIILALLSAGVFSTAMSSRYLVNRSKRRVIAIELAKLAMEELQKNIGLGTPNYSLITAGSSTWFNVTGSPFTVNGMTYIVEMRSGPSMIPTGGVGPPDYRPVTVRVRWNETTI